jgi:hypothetical protein
MPRLQQAAAHAPGQKERVRTKQAIFNGVSGDAYEEPESRTT